MIDTIGRIWDEDFTEQIVSVDIIDDELHVEVTNGHVVLTKAQAHDLALMLGRAERRL